MYNVFALILLLGVAGISASPAIAARGCNADNCLRAIEAAAFVTRQGTIDCSSYFRTTITPATVTVTQTASQKISTAISLTNTVILTSTQTKVLTLSTPVTTTSIETDLITLTITVPEVTVVTFNKRQATATPSSIPAYASPCSGSVRYSSACSCVGATKSTVIAAVPSTTVTVTQSFTQTSTYQTTTSTITFTTDLTTTTVAVTNTLDLTTTITNFATTTLIPVVPTCLSSAFQIQALSGSASGRYAELYNVPGLGGGYFTLNFIGPLSGASTFSIDDGTGYISTGGYDGVLEIDVQESPFLFVQYTRADTTDSLVSCAIGVGNTFSCVGSQGQTIFQTCPALGSDYANDVVLATSLGMGCTALVLQAICPVTTTVSTTAP